MRETQDPLSPRSIIAGLLITIVGGVVVAFLVAALQIGVYTPETALVVTPTALLIAKKTLPPLMSSPTVPLSVNRVCSPLPKLISPLDNSQLSTLIPVFQWDNSQSTLAQGCGVEVSTTPDFRVSAYREWEDFQGVVRPLVESKQASTSYNLLPATTYYWRAFFVCDGGNKYSDVWSFTTGSKGTFLPSPQILSPENDSDVRPGNITIKWVPVNGAVGYIFFFDNGSPYRVDRTEMTYTLSPVSPIEQRLRVAAYNGFAIGDSSMVYFTVRP